MTPAWLLCFHVRHSRVEEEAYFASRGAVSCTAEMNQPNIQTGNEAKDDLIESNPSLRVPRPINADGFGAAGQVDDAWPSEAERGSALRTPSSVFTSR